MRVLLVEAQSGISGDMFVAAAAALAGCEEEVVALPAKLGLAGVTCVFRDVVRSSLRCRKFEVEEGLRPAGEGALRGVLRPEPRDEPRAAHAGHGHAHRPLAEIRAMIEAADLEAVVRARAMRMFDRLGAVEAAAHGIPVEDVHFHEVGAVDSIIDIVAAALCIERLAIEATHTTPVCVGSGTVRTDHGVLPVPAPATEKLLQGLPAYPGELTGEWTTPTGALILAELGAQATAPVVTTRASALGAGNRDPRARVNALRLRLGETAVAAAASQAPGASLERDELVAVCCNLDDASGELLGADLIDALLRAGARDAVIQPVIMKKGRPGQRLEVLVEAARAEEMGRFILAHTSTIGVRMHRVSRLMLPREAVVLATPYGAIAGKAVRLPDGRKRIKPEYESCREAAARAGVPVQEVYRAAAGAATTAAAS